MVDECHDRGGLRDGTRASCGSGAGNKVPESGCAAEAEECELDQVLCLHVCMGSLLGVDPCV